MKNKFARLTFLSMASVCVLLSVHQPAAQAQVPLPPTQAATPAHPTVAQAIAGLPPDVRAKCVAAGVSTQSAGMHMAETAQLLRGCLASRDLPVVLRIAMLEALALAQAALRDGNAAIESQLAAIELEPAPTDLEWFYLADLYDENHQYEQGLATLDRIRDAHEARHDLDASFGVAYYLELGKNRAASGHAQDAIDDFSKVISAMPANAGAYALRARERERVGDKDGARADYIEWVRWVSADSVDETMHAKLASLGIDAERERRHPFGSANPLLELQQQSEKDAEQALRTADTTQAKAQAYWDLSDALDGLGQRERALSAIDKAIALDPSDVHFGQSKVTTLVGLHRLDDAFAAAAPLFKRMHDELAEAKNPAEVHRKYVELTSSACWAYILKGDWSNAIAMMEDSADGADAIDQDYLAALYLIVRARSDNAVPANAYFEDYIRRSAFSAEPNYRRALLHYVLGHVSLKVVYSMIDLVQSPAARENALAETWMMAAGYERFIKHEDAAARVFKERINDLQPYGTTEWMMVQFGGM